MRLNIINKDLKVCVLRIAIHNFYGCIEIKKKWELNRIGLRSINSLGLLLAIVFILSLFLQVSQTIKKKCAINSH